MSPLKTDHKFENRWAAEHFLLTHGFQIGPTEYFVKPSPVPGGYPINEETGHPLELAVLFDDGALSLVNKENSMIAEYHDKLRRALAAETADSN